MTQNNSQVEQFTGLILLTGVDNPGIASSLFETLSPFAVHVIDIEQIVINHRLILTVLIGANAAHQSAIEEDLAACAEGLNVDIATLFGKGELAVVNEPIEVVSISAQKLLPGQIASVTQSISNCGGNIEKFERVSSQPVSIHIRVSGTSKAELDSALTALSFEDDTLVKVLGK